MALVVSSSSEREPSGEGREGRGPDSTDPDGEDNGDVVVKEVVT